MSIATFLLSCNNTPKVAGFEGEDLMQQANITRNKETKEATFVSTLTDKWELYYGTSVDSIDFSQPILTGEGAGSFALAIPTEKRAYFQLITPQGKAIIAERRLPMVGGFNFRDIGGYKTKDNRYVKWGKIFRSDELSTLTDADLMYLSSIPIINIVDFRSQYEIDNAKDKIPQSVKAAYNYSISPGNLSDMVKSISDLDSNQVDTIMEGMNELFATDSVAIDQYRKMFALLQNPTKETPLLYHCTAGKDRTGMATALILFALGVDEKGIMQDYLLSSQYIEAKFAEHIKAQPQLIGLFSVKEQYLQAGINKIREENGSIEKFLTQKLNVNIEKFRDTYLYQ
ncbi:MAG: tyrosine-protein phosphatase [Paludibacteraceae bacterium]